MNKNMQRVGTFSNEIVPVPICLQNPSKIGHLHALTVTTT